ncbi:MAG: PH domain-containing protein [Candidatus Diapherotrites archaeon]|nr:PH domain-containing protein [Candidatus Diapherotrites archaeon]
MELEKDEEIITSTVASIEAQLIQGVDMGIVGKSFGWTKLYLTNKRLIIGESRGSSPIVLPLGKIQQFRIDEAWLRGIYNKIQGRETIRIKYVDKNGTKEMRITADKGEIATLLEKLRELCPSMPIDYTEETKPKLVQAHKGERQKPTRPGW